MITRGRTRRNTAQLLNRAWDDVIACSIDVRVLAEFKAKIANAATDEERAIIQAYMEDYKSATAQDPIRVRPNARFLSAVLDNVESENTAQLKKRPREESLTLVDQEPRQKIAKPAEATTPSAKITKGRGSHSTRVGGSYSRFSEESDLQVDYEVQKKDERSDLDSEPRKHQHKEKRIKKHKHNKRDKR